MKKMKLFQKTYLFTVGLMAIIIIISHTLLYMLLPSFYTNKKQQDLDNISYQLTEQLQNNNSNKSDEIAKKFADMHNINIRHGHEASCMPESSLTHSIDPLPVSLIVKMTANHMSIPHILCFWYLSLTDLHTFPASGMEFTS